jgi:hypothetical protein
MSWTTVVAGDHAVEEEDEVEDEEGDEEEDEEEDEEAGWTEAGVTTTASLSQYSEMARRTTTLNAAFTKDPPRFPRRSFSHSSMLRLLVLPPSMSPASVK